MNGRAAARLSAAFAVICCLSPLPVRAGQSDASTVLFDLRVPGGVTGVLEAAGLRETAEPSLGLLPAIRALHNTATPTAAQRAIQQAVLARMASFAQPDKADDVVPLPLSPEIWTSVVFAGKLPQPDLASAILADRRAALGYHGLMALDEATLAFLAANPAVLTEILARAAPGFAVHGRSIRIRGGVVQVPGGERAQASWQQVVGAPPTDVPAFILALLTRDEGRCAEFYDTVAHLDAAGQSFALGLAQPAEAPRRVRSLYKVFSSFLGTKWRPIDFPFARRSNDPASVLMQLRVAADGELAAPAGPVLWKAVFDGRAAGCRDMNLAVRDQARADAGWMLERLFAQTAERRLQMLETIAFAQRVFANAETSAGPAVCETLVAFPAYQGLLLALEAIGGFAPADYASLVRAASALKPGDQGVYLAQIQGALAIVERAAAARSLGRGAARQLVQALFAFNAEGMSREQALFKPDGTPITRQVRVAGGLLGHVGAWMITGLLPALRCGLEAADDCVAGATGGPPPGDQLAISWEGDRYRVDYRASARERARRVRAAQQANRLSDVLAFFEVERSLLASMFAGADAQRQAAILKEASGRVAIAATDRFGVGSPPVGRIVGRIADVASRASRTDADSKAEALANLLRLADVLLADTLTSFAYTLAITDPDSSLLLAGDPGRRHDFGRAWAVVRTPNGPWRVAEERRMPDGVWTVQGSLLGLSRVLAGFSVRRLSIDSESGTPAALDVRDTRAFAESALALDPWALDDGVRARLVSGIDRGRGRIRALLADSPAFTAAVSEVGISEWRATGARWAARQSIDRALGFFSLAELFWLGDDSAGGGGVTPALDAWGVTTRAIDASWRLRLPRGHAWEDFAGRPATALLATQVADLNLRIAECLAALRLPSALVPGIASYAVWDFTTGARMADPEDWLGVVSAARLITIDRVADYVSALTAPDGPLVPIK